METEHSASLRSASVNSDSKVIVKSGDSPSEDHISSKNTKGEESEKSTSSLTRFSASYSDDFSKSKDQSSSVHLRKSPWEEWLLKKALQTRARVKQSQMEKLAKEAEKLKLSEERHRKQQLTAVKLELWSAAKKKEAQRMAEIKRQAVLEEKAERVKQLQLEGKSKEAYKKWTLQKLQEMKDTRLKSEEKYREIQLKLEEKRRTNEAAYSNWLKDASKTAAPDHRCYGYTCGKIISWKC